MNILKQNLFNLLAFLSLSFFGLTTSSCSKDYTCVCDMGSYNSTETIEADSKDEAQKKCDESERAAKRISESHSCRLK